MTFAGHPPTQFLSSVHSIPCYCSTRTIDLVAAIDQTLPPPNAGRDSPFAIRHSSFAIRHSSFVVIRHSSFAIRHSPFVIFLNPNLRPTASLY